MTSEIKTLVTDMFKLLKSASFQSAPSTAASTEATITVKGEKAAPTKPTLVQQLFRRLDPHRQTRKDGQTIEPKTQED